MSFIAICWYVLDTAALIELNTNSSSACHCPHGSKLVMWIPCVQSVSSLVSLNCSTSYHGLNEQGHCSERTETGNRVVSVRRL